MTHDELLAKIDGIKPLNSPAWDMQNALRAVVELTRKYEEFEDVDVEKMQGYRLAMKQVIQAIEKELK